jgi:hypothetical protein
MGLLEQVGLAIDRKEVMPTLPGMISETTMAVLAEGLSYKVTAGAVASASYLLARSSPIRRSPSPCPRSSPTWSAGLTSLLAGL